jgi:hypothetical protein
MPSEEVKSSSSPESYAGPKWDLGTIVAGVIRRDGNFTLGVLLTLAESLGLTPGQLTSYKKLVRREMYNMIDSQQGSMYAALEDAEVSKFLHRPVTTRPTTAKRSFNYPTRIRLILARPKPTPNM